MAQNSFKKILVIGDNHEEIIKKYSLDTKVEKYVYARLDDAPKSRQTALSNLEKIINSNNLMLTDLQRTIYNNQYMDIKEMSDFDYYLYSTKGCTYDEENGDALSDVNPNAHYKYEKCYQKSLLKYGEDGEGTFSSPFILKDGTKSYSAKKGDIDWSKNHMYNTQIYEAAWDIVVNGKKPENEQEEIIEKNMSRKTEYFKSFKNKKDYVEYSCSFWCYGVATEKEYKEMTDAIEDKYWIANFFEKYIAPLSDDTLLTIYEAHSI